MRKKKKTQNRTPFRLAHGLSLFEPLTPHRQGNASLSLTKVRDLLPQPRLSVASFFEISLVTTKRLRQQLASVARRERLVDAGGARHEVTQARSKSEGLAT